MPIITTITYELPDVSERIWKKYNDNPNEVITGIACMLVDDVIESIKEFDNSFTSDRLKALEIIKKENYSIPGQEGIIDLSEAKEAIDDYMELFNTEGCNSCKHSGSAPFQSYFTNYPERTYHDEYCKLHDKQGVELENPTKRIKELKKIGCEDKQSIITKSIEEILK